MITTITNTTTLNQLTVLRQITVIELTEILNEYQWSPVDCVVTVVKANYENEL